MLLGGVRTLIDGVQPLRETGRRHRRLLDILYRQLFKSFLDSPSARRVGKELLRIEAAEAQEEVGAVAQERTPRCKVAAAAVFCADRQAGRQAGRQTE